jgi:CO/xanthine dehydrogenase Mo-binding subunit
VAHDCGRVVHHAIVEAQLFGGMVPGIGNACFGRMIFDEAGQHLTTALADCMMLTAGETWNMDIIHFTSPNQLGVKGVGGCDTDSCSGYSAVENALASAGVSRAR